MNVLPTTGAVSAEIYYDIQRFLADEAALLERHDYAAWFALLTPDISYRVAVHQVRSRGSREQVHEIIDEDSDNLRLRVDQLANPKLTVSENPASLYRRFVTNIRADTTEIADTFAVKTNVLVYKNRTGNDQVDLYAGEREDVLRRVDGSLRIASRLVRLDQSVLLGGTLSTLL